MTAPRWRKCGFCGRRLFFWMSKEEKGDAAYRCDDCGVWYWPGGLVMSREGDKWVDVPAGCMIVRKNRARKQRAFKRRTEDE